MAAGTQEKHQFIHLVRLSWDLRVLGVTTSLVLPATGPPVLEILSTARVEIRVRVIRRAWGWVFTWRPWWAVLWRRSEWVWVGDDFAANLIMAAVTA